MTRFLLPTLFEDVLEECSALRKAGCCENTNCCSVSLFEDEKSLVVEAPVPGVKAEDIHVTFEEGGLLIEAKAQEEKKDVKYHFKSTASYSYWTPLPKGKVDERSKPDAIYKDRSEEHTSELQSQSNLV